MAVQVANTTGELRIHTNPQESIPNLHHDEKGSSVFRTRNIHTVEYTSYKNEANLWLAGVLQKFRKCILVTDPPSVSPTVSISPTTSTLPTVSPSVHPTLFPSTPPSLSISPSIIPSVSQPPSPLFSTSLDVSSPKSDDNDFFGVVVDVFDPHIIVGAPLDDNMRGSVYLMDIQGKIIHTLQAPIQNEYEEWFGYSVSIWNHFIAVGAPAYGTHTATGAAYLFHSTTGSFSFNLTASVDLQEEDLFGASISISETYVAVGATGVNHNTGAVYLFDLNALESTPIVIVPEDVIEGSEFGDQVSISKSIVVVSALVPNEAYIYHIHREEDKFTKIISRDSAIRISTDGDNVVVGVAFENHNRGSAYVWDSLGNFQYKLVDPDPAQSLFFGSNVDVSSRYIAVSTSCHVFLFDKMGVLLAKRSAFCNSGGLAVSNDTLVLGDWFFRKVRIIK